MVEMGYIGGNASLLPRTALAPAIVPLFMQRLLHEILLKYAERRWMKRRPLTSHQASHFVNPEILLEFAVLHRRDTRYMIHTQDRDARILAYICNDLLVNLA